MSSFDADKMLEALTEGENSDGVVADPVEAVPPSASPSVRASKKKTKDSLVPKQDASKDSGRVQPPSGDEGVSIPLSARPEKVRRGMARQMERSGRCPMYAQRGTTCKVCGKVHPL